MSISFIETETIEKVPTDEELEYYRNQKALHRNRKNRRYDECTMEAIIETQRMLGFC